ncbi:MAG: hypothetical protein O7C59_11225 [Rickettsia endosymbiont of Ixodes persulcatus]|nr:hypothetical protein [Rickettsia endosymbiont of Ixodes persulcatus]MCZ6901628.1 hypothetical protein [Rickettsia endosymbiont of Ixodes persulcatus]MCZ6903164.1 hypothetical protein [Rickettsia endosymbiont of Ixodes persulcatus]MCZ6909229.1 hypothetical protein [Rickettsia endosymbiont of Ixodes persulcatus]MCZ6911047.1 hypothetical protein [Rickettsia endosymbiont of Ixodes persulcatus]
MGEILIDSKEAVLEFFTDETYSSGEYNTPTIFDLVNSGDIFTSAELETPTTIPSDDTFTVMYNTAVKLVSLLVGYMYGFFWGGK